MGWWCVVGSSGLGYVNYIRTKNSFGFPLLCRQSVRLRFCLVCGCACAFVTSIWLGYCLRNYTSRSRFTYVCMYSYHPGPPGLGTADEAFMFIYLCHV